MKVVFPSPKKGSLNLLYGVYNTCKIHTWIGPKIFNVWGKPKTKKLKVNKAESKKIFEIAEDIYSKIEEH